MKNVIGEEYKSNSHKSKGEVRKEDKKIEKVATGKVKTKKKSGANKFSDVFVTEDISSVKDYILYDVLLPAAKKTLSEIVSMVLICCYMVKQNLRINQEEVKYHIANIMMIEKTIIEEVLEEEL